MQINNAHYSISDILSMLDRRELYINSDYQRGSGIWPQGASSYFIDTILEAFPFPKIYIFEYFDRDARRTRKELVDGQQRISTIQRYVNDEFAISGDSRYAGRKFSDLDDEDQNAFLHYAVPVDVIRNARRSQILEMFRRMNAFTLPLNESEKRHSSFQGQFKWFVNDLASDLNEFFLEYGVFRNREIVRMADAELLTDVILAMEQGIVSTSNKNLKDLYSRYDSEFGPADEYRHKITSSVEYILENFDRLRGTFLMKKYALHSLLTALIHARFEIPALTHQLNVASMGRFSAAPQESARTLEAIALAHEAKELVGEFSMYVRGATSSTHRRPQRSARVATILRALGAEVPERDYFNEA